VIFSGVDRGTTAVGLAAGDSWQTKEVWHNKEVSFYLSSPVVVEGRLFGLSHRRRGELVCLDAVTGKLLWSGPNRLGDNASLAVAGKTLLVSTTNSELLVVDPAADSFQLLARYKVASTPTWAHVAVLEKHLLFKDAENLTLWAVGK
jgi:outer membrane protein assembly factor BamB